MAELSFKFKEESTWTMGPACCTPDGESINPAPTTPNCIYIIHNTSSNETYAGYADNAKNRWATRFESFHCFGIEKGYAQGILCAYCVPKVKESTQHLHLEGTGGFEHWLIRAVVNGLLGVTTSTNTQLRKTPVPTNGIHRISITLPTKSDKWGHLSNGKFQDFDGTKRTY